PRDALITLGLAAGMVALLALLATLGTSLTIRTLRLLVYTRHMHGAAEHFLLTQAPLYQAGIQPRLVPFDFSGQPQRAREQSIEQAMMGSRLLLLLGEAGAGKSVALHALATGLTRRRTLGQTLLHRAPLPMLVSLGTYARRRKEGQATLRRDLAQEALELGSP